MKIIHISDTHIRNLKYHDVYKDVFAKLYKKVSSLKPDLIVHTGDLAHTKCHLSPEYFLLAKSFLENLADITETLVIPGNHDGLVNNPNRLDAIEPIVNHDKIIYSKFSENLSFEKNGKTYNFHHLSIFDHKSKWLLTPENKDEINIALFHGPIYGAITDVDWVIDNEHFTVEMFKYFDYALLGDIHKSNQIMDKEGRIRYAGSTIQQNFAEDDDKGFLEWQIEGKDDWEVTHHIIKNPKPFITIPLDEKCNLSPPREIPEKSRLRIMSLHNHAISKIRKSVDQAKVKYNPESVVYVSNTPSEETTSLSYPELAKDLRSIKTQEGLIKDFLEKYEIEDSVLKKIYKINRRINSDVIASEEIDRNVKWSVQKLEFSNLFNFGPNNRIDFNKLHGTVGIFGKNYSGKSSIVSSLTWALFNTIAKNQRKTVNIVNEHKDNAKAEVTIDISGDEYKIDRQAFKYDRTVKGVKSTEARTELSFTKEGGNNILVNLEENSRTETDKSIRKIFGDFDDFELTSYVSQHNALSFIDEGSTKRKEILARFLDLDIFDKKYKIANKEARSLKREIKKLEGLDFSKDIAESKEKKKKKKEQIEINNGYIFEIEEGIDKEMEKFIELEKEISSLEVTEQIDINSVTDKIDTLNKEIKELEKEEKQLRGQISDDSSNQFRLKRNNLDEKIEKVEKEIAALEQLIIKVSNKKKEIETLEDKINEREEAASDYENRPCGDEYISSCGFLKNVEVKAKEYKELVEKYSHYKDFIGEHDLKALNDSLSNFLSERQKYKADKRKIREYDKTIENHHLKLEICATNKRNKLVEINNLEDKVEKYEREKENQKKYRELEKEKKKLQNNIDLFTKDIENFRKENNSLTKEVGSLEEKIKNLKEKQKELDKTRKEYDAYYYYLKCMHSNGISFNIVKDKLQKINEEIAKIMATACNFEVYFEAGRGNRLEIYLKHPKHNPRPLEMGSGAEKTISSMAIRLALLKMSSLPQGDIFILDEPASDLDPDNMNGFINMLDMVKNHFKVVFLISHLEHLKDIVDNTITIQKKRGFAYVKV